ncbi:Gamma-tubulin complex component 2 [Auxenochlorella protothecoides]|uniref:Gamma-tubulin complex component n=1 Tax=Auxenochlorella protothecoides TaxID=3075 RepID=A0A087SGR2_AUXPR|nr:Gamma-tubulin complex component 2 [Auxenochlorella protothecoides]KFM24916.1 Gamma-tubulin complex component 2 [Auxenochlorella protothecoides]
MQGDSRRQVDTPGVRAALEANRAQLEVMRSRLLGKTPLPRKLAQDYHPKYADAIRATPPHLTSPDGDIPPVGDLFTPDPSAPELARGTAPPAPAPPTWTKQRPFLTGYYLMEAAAAQQDAAPAQLDIFPAEIQESLLVDGLLSAFMGLSGEYVSATMEHGAGGPSLRYRITTHSQVEPALAEMAGRMLPICEAAAVVQRFAETRDDARWGLVAQALTGALRALIQDWHVMVAQLEHQMHTGKLTLQALWYYVQPPLEALRLVAGLCAEASARGLRGAPLLDLLHDRAARSFGDARAHALLTRLLRAAAAPYFAMLARWVGEGELADPCGEFLVQEDASVRPGALTHEGQSAFWHDRWRLRLAEAAILDAGKYLNVLKSCGQDLPADVLELGVPLEWDEGGRYLRALERARAVAAGATMRMLRGDRALASGLGVLGRYFLTAQGDLFGHLMDSAGAEFGRMVAAVPLLQLQALLSAAVRGSSAAAVPAAAQLRAAFDTRSVLNMLVSITQTAAATAGVGQPGSPLRRGLKPVTPAPMSASERQTVGRQKNARESFMLSYAVPWPLSVVAPEACMAQYQMIFRHMFELKWVERELNRVWQLHLQTRGLASVHSRTGRSLATGRGPAPSLGRTRAASAVALSRSCAVCQLVTHFFRQYLLYITFEVLEPLWLAFQHRVQTLDSLDEVLEQHHAFLRRVMKGCLLSRKVVLLRSLLALKDLALQFVKVSDRVLGALAEAGEKEVEAAYGGPCVDRGRRSSTAGEGPVWGERAVRAARRRSTLDAALSQPVFLSTVNTLYARCVERVGEFRAHLADAHRAAASERSDTREDLESLLNLQQRLDYNAFFPEPRPKAPPPPRG